MMEGLYLWGEWTFLTGHQRVLEFLGWEGLDAGGLASNQIDTELKRAKKALCDRFGAGPDCSNPHPEVLLKNPDQLREYYKAQRKRARKSMTRCASE